ncbi:hypothetical protein D3C87_1200180 [compost metagenome]
MVRRIAGGKISDAAVAERNQPARDVFGGMPVVSNNGVDVERVASAVEQRKRQPGADNFMQVLDVSFLGR